MKRIDTGFLRKSVTAYILLFIVIWMLVLAFSIGILQEFNTTEHTISMHGYHLLGLFVSMCCILLVLLWLINRRIGMYEEQISTLYHEQIEKIHVSNALLLESQSKLKNIFDTTPNIMLITNGLEITMVNEALLEFFDYKSVKYFKAEHKCICDFFLPQEDTLLAEMEGSDWLHYVLSHPLETHKVCMLKGSKKHYFLLKANRLGKDIHNDTALVVLSDVTDIEEMRVRYEYAINGSKDGIWDWNLESGEIYFSPRWKALVGYEDTELENVLFTWEALVHPDDLNEAETEFVKNMEGKTEYYENIHRLKHKDGHWVWILDRGKTIFNYEKKAVRMVGFHTDISEIKKLEQELREKEEMLIAQSRNAAMGEMISMIAHQWRQPISVIAMGANNIIVDIELDMLEVATLKNEVENIIAQTQELSKTIDDFRDFFKPNREKEDVLAEDILNASLSIISKSLENNTIEIENIFNSTTKLSLYSRELEQVFINLLNNAKESLVETREQERKITNTIYETAQNIIIEISDNGGGFSETNIDKIFEPYFSTKSSKNGTGLGLYMSKTIIEKHFHGKLWAKNSAEGAVVVIELPKGLRDD